MPELAVIKKKNGLSLFYSDTGTGTPIFFIHGWLMSQRVWSLQGPLSSRYRIITLDLPGHGSAGDTDFSYNACCEDIGLLFNRLQLDRVIMVGWSLGAQLAIKVFPEIKNQVAAMVLVGGTPHFCNSSDVSYGLAPAEARGMTLRIKKDYRRTAEEFFAGMFSQEEKGTIDMRTLAGSVVGNLPSRNNALSALNELIHADMRAYLPLVSVPVMLIHGTDDKICRSSASMYMAEQIASAKIELICSAGHAPFLSNPDAFNRIVTGFVEAING